MRRSCLVCKIWVSHKHGFSLFSPTHFCVFSKNKAIWLHGTQGKDPNQSVNVNTICYLLTLGQICHRVQLMAFGDKENPWPPLVTTLSNCAGVLQPGVCAVPLCLLGHWHFLKGAIHLFWRIPPPFGIVWYFFTIKFRLCTLGRNTTQAQIFLGTTDQESHHSSVSHGGKVRHMLKYSFVWSSVC